MAETDADRRAAGAMTEEEADRLSEQFRPSWEEDPPTVPREQPIPTPPAEPRSRPAPSGPAVTTAPVVNITNATPAAAPQDKPAAAEDKPAAAPASAPLIVTAARKPTLVGTAPPTPVVRTEPQAPMAEDLDWEVATNPRPEAEAPMQIEVEELPPESKPSGIGQKYKPKDEGAPAVVLGVDIQQAESSERVKLEAEHRSRRAPTIVRMNAFDLPNPQAVAPAPEPELAVPRKRSFGLVAMLGLLVIGGGAAVAIMASRGGSSAEAPKGASAPSTTAAAIAPDTAAPAPPPAAPDVPAAEPTQSAPAPTSAASAAPSVAIVTPVPVTDQPAATTKPARTPAVAPKAPAPVAKSAPKPAAAKAPAKPAGTPSKPAAKTGGKNTIVRETPF